MKRNIISNLKRPFASSSFKNIIGIIRPHIRLAALSIVFAILSVIFMLYIPILVGDAIDCIVKQGRVDFDMMMPILIKIQLFAVLAAILQWLMNAVNNKITFEAVRDMRKRAFRKLEELPISYLDSHPSGDIVSRIITDVDTFADGLLLGFSQLFTGLMTILVTIVFMLNINPIIALIVMLLTPISLLVARAVSKRTYSMFRLQSATRGEQTAFIEEAIGNAKVIKAFSHEEETRQKFNEIDDRLKDSSLQATFFSSLVNPSTRFVNGIVYAAVGLFGALSVMGALGGNAMTVGALSGFLSYANQYTKPFNEISGVMTELQNAIACLDRIFEFLNEPSRTPDIPDATELSDVDGNITFDQVSFSYDKDKELIRNIELSVRSGQHVAIVGPTGCGKTTIINLLMRFYDADRGNIYIDGFDIRKVKRSSLRKSYGMVLQDTWIKNATVKENIAMGRPDADDELIISAAKAAHAHSFIKRLPNGYDTVISDDARLSQGQKQLLCIARVMLCLPPMLILDEATSSIDTRTEQRIQGAFSKLMKGRTSFIVAHRLSTVRDADMILVMREGNIVEIGKHNELLKKKGFYSMLYNSQFDTYS